MTRKVWALLLVLPQSPASLVTWEINVSAWKQNLDKGALFEKWSPEAVRVNERGM